MNTPLYCIELLPKPLDDRKAQRHLAILANGVPQDEVGRIIWTSLAMSGASLHRERQFLRVRQRLALFTNKAEAGQRAKAETNEFWHAKVRLARLMVEPPPLRRRCSLCGQMVRDWVDPDWAKGRVCRPCETKHQPTEF